KVIAFFQTHFPADEQAISNECDYLGTFLAIVGIISAPAVIFPDEVTQRSSDFIRGFEERFGVTLTLEAKQNITYEVDKCWIDSVAFPLRSGFFEYHTEIAYFARTFPEFFEYCQTYVQQQEAALDDQQAQFIFYRCLLTLVANVPLSSVLEPLYVCVDFTLGEAYITIIERGIKRFSMLNVKVTNEVQPKTRLIITDLVNAYRHTDIPKVIWLSPP
ncbi:MAG TPA: DNA-binding protein, partial [Lactobacillus sp.]|nr:DNA-binding protein [Lactobacillus sp.]